MKDLLKKLADLEPERFVAYGGFIWMFGDDPTCKTIYGPEYWLQEALAQEGVTRIDRADGQSWEEAMLHALVEAVERRVKE